MGNEIVQVTDTLTREEPTKEQQERIDWLYQQNLERLGKRYTKAALDMAIMQVWTEAVDKL